MCKLEIKAYESLGVLKKQTEKFINDENTSYQNIEDSIFKLEILIMQNNTWMKIWAKSIQECPDDSSIYSKQIIYASQENEKLQELIDILRDELVKRRTDGIGC